MSQIEPNRKLVIPLHIEMLLCRTEEAFRKLIRSQTSPAIREELAYYLENLKDFHTSLKNGQHSLLHYSSYEEAYQAKTQIMQEIHSYWAYLPSPAIHNIEGKVTVARGLMHRLRKVQQLKPESKAEVKLLMDFIETASTSGWNQSDEFYIYKEFLLVNTEKEFEELLEHPDIEDLTYQEGLRVPHTTIRVARRQKDVDKVCEEKGLLEEYLAFINLHFSSPGDAKKTFCFWHDIQPTAVFFVWPGFNN